MALLRVSSCRRQAARIRCAVLSARIDGLRLVGVGVGLQGGDDPVEVAEHLLVHLSQPLLVAGFGGRDDRQDLLAVLAVLGQEPWGGDKHRAGQAGVRCPMLWPDPAQRDRLVEIRDNLSARIAEAEREGWLGEVEGLQVSLAGAQDKLAQLDRRTRNRTTVDLGIPTVAESQANRVCSVQRIRNLVIGLLRLAGQARIARALRWIARNPVRALALLGV